MFSSASGHVNPVCGLVHELCQQPDVECVFYGIEEHRQLIEKTGAQFRLYSDRNVADTVLPQVSERHREFVFTRFMNRMIDSSYHLLPELIRDVEAEKPDMIIIDPGFITSKYLIEILKKRGIHVKCVEFFPHFVMTQAMMESVPGLVQKSLRMFLAIIYLFIRQIWLSWTFGISLYNPMDLLVGKKDHLKIVAIFPQLHPRLEDYDNTYRFVGHCISEQTRNYDLSSDHQLKSTLDLFSIRTENLSQPNDLKLVYMSLGTIFNHNLFLFEKVIQALKDFDKKADRSIKSCQIKTIISLGESGMKAFEEKLARRELELPDNILLRAKVPQLEVLKRADLFITHCGMNSASETIKYGVPVVAVPIDGDQPLVAKRICDELSLGVRLDPLTIEIDQIGNAIDRVLSEDTFRTKIRELSKVSAIYNGKVDGAKIVMDFLNQKDMDLKKLE